MSRHTTRPLMILHGKELLDSYLKKCLIGRADFLTSKRPEFVEQRCHMIRILMEAGLRSGEVCRVMRSSRDRIRYWTDPSYRQKRLDIRRVELRT